MDPQAAATEVIRNLLNGDHHAVKTIFDNLSNQSTGIRPDSLAARVVVRLVRQDHGDQVCILIGILES
ncbi:MAG: hypothetical protein JRD89_01950 [Deltaproteobacteria bacterium]|nr:hypothetical protein [Deltaproteobacteria bacterium]